MLVSQMQRLTKYPLLLDNIIKHTEGEESKLHSMFRDKVYNDNQAFWCVCVYDLS